MNKKSSSLIYPVLFWMSFLVLIPLLYILALSFLTRASDGSILIKFTLENYFRIFDVLYFKIFVNTFSIAIYTSIITLIIGYPFAYFIAKLNDKWKVILLAVVLIPFWSSSLLRVYGWVILLQKNGIINSALISSGIIKEPLKLMLNYSAVLIGTSYMLLPFMILPLFNSIDKLDRSFIEASYDLGASKLSTFIKITLPMTQSGIAGGLMLVFIPAVGLFFVSDLLGGSQTMLLGNLVSNQITSVRNLPFASAISIVMFAFVILVFIYYFKITKGKGKRFYE